MVRQSMHWVQRNLTARFPKNLNSKRSSHDVPLSYFDPKEATSKLVARSYKVFQSVS